MRKLYLALAAILAILMAGITLARCSAPTVPPAPLPVAPAMPAATSAATSSTVATMEQDLEIIIPPRRVAQNPYTAAQTRTRGPQTQQPRDGQVDENLPGPYSIEQEEPIVIRIRQTATTAASSEASASAAVPLEWVRREEPSREDSHARLGVMVATVPGAIAITYQLARVDVPPWVVGAPLEVGLEVEGNLSQLGGGVSVGSKAFATAGGYMGWEGPGWYLGLGLRF